MSRVFRRRDRTARLLKLQILLCNYPNGLKVKEIASQCSVSRRTIYRDLKALESELDIPLWEEGSRRGICDGYFLPPVNFTLEEAMSIFLAARLMQSHTSNYSPSIVSAFSKLETVLPKDIKTHIQRVIDYMNQQPVDQTKIINFNKLTQAWLSQHRVKIWYKEKPDEKPVERIIEPYIIAPLEPLKGNYVIAYCHYKKSIYAYKMNSIIGEVHIEDDVYEIPSDFNHNEYFTRGKLKKVYTRC